jgi:hypothetical protein
LVARHTTASDAPRSIWDLFLIAVIYKITTFIEPLLTPEHIFLPSPIFYTIARFSLWSLYGFTTGLVFTGLWVIGHECGHQAFSDSKFINNLAGWIIHSWSVVNCLVFSLPVRLPLGVVPGANGKSFRTVSEFLTTLGELPMPSTTLRLDT